MRGETVVLPPILRRATHLAQRQVGEETVVLDLRESRIYGFNPEGGELLLALKEGAETAALRAAARQTGEETALCDFLAELVALGLVVAAEDDAGGETVPVRSGNAPRLLWREEVARATNQISPPQHPGNPQCQF